MKQIALRLLDESWPTSPTGTQLLALERGTGQDVHLILLVMFKKKSMGIIMYFNQNKPWDSAVKMHRCCYLFSRFSCILSSVILSLWSDTSLQE